MDRLRRKTMTACTNSQSSRVQSVKVCEASSVFGRMGQLRLYKVVGNSPDNKHPIYEPIDPPAFTEVDVDYLGRDVEQLYKSEICRLSWNGYVVLSGGRPRRLNRLVLGLAIGDPREGHHKDEDRRNNTLGNLEILSHSAHYKVHEDEKRLLGAEIAKRTGLDRIGRFVRAERCKKRVLAIRAGRRSGTLRAAVRVLGSRDWVQLGLFEHEGQMERAIGQFFLYGKVPPKRVGRGRVRKVTQF